MLMALGIPSDAVDSDSSIDQSTDDEESVDDWTESDQLIEKSVQYDRTVKITFAFIQGQQRNILRFGI